MRAHAKVSNYYLLFVISYLVLLYKSVTTLVVFKIVVAKRLAIFRIYLMCESINALSSCTAFI